VCACKILCTPFHEIPDPTHFSCSPYFPCSPLPIHINFKVKRGAVVITFSCEKPAIEKAIATLDDIYKENRFLLRINSRLTQNHE
jgi:hypothetical protein